jgi:hypothetical protein
VPPPPVRLGELTAEPVAKLGADQGHGRSLHRQGFLGGQPAQPQARQVAACGSIPDLGPGVGGPGAQFHGQVGHEHQLLWLPVGVAGHQLVQQGAVWLGDGRVQQRGRGHHQHPAGVLVAGWSSSRPR